MKHLYKLGHFEPEEQKYEHPNIWTIEQTTGPDRLILGPAKNHISFLVQLTRAMPEPFWVLYVLTVSRSEHLPGRYQSDSPKTREEIEEFLTRFGSFFENDGRHSVWVGSEPGPELLVYDRHNKIYAYGPLDKFSSLVSGDALSLSNGVPIPCPHSHHYHEEFDAEEVAIMRHWSWSHFPLVDSDDD
jgi:hypothetical protein